MIGRLGASALVSGLLRFWALYFAVVTLSNAADLLRHVHGLPAAWWWVSGNLAFIATGTAKFGAPEWLNAVLLAGVVAWEGTTAVLFWRARLPGRSDVELLPPFVLSLTLWAIFIVLDEVLLIFETGAEATHLRLFTATLATLVAIRLVPRDAAVR